ncbi:MAG TPA: substrate-binding domain-containing protein, partial [Chloroflexota bacterium]|nr:substrate-binding domain-containing protein [Chloroflexota bacterium]
VRDIEDLFFSSAVAAITTAARVQGYNVVLGHVQSSADEAVALSEVLQAGHCDGIILLGDLRGQARLWSDLKDHQTPIVGLWQGARAPRISVVNVDNRHGIRLALEYLVQLGHERIAFLQGGRTGDGLERRTAYVAFMRERALAVPDRYLQVCANELAEAAAAARRLLALDDRPTAVLASTDVVAIGALKAAWRAGLPVPAELSIVGFDDIRLAAFAIPALTTVRQPIEAIAERAVSQLLTLIANPNAPRRSVVIEPSLVVRESCSAPLHLITDRRKRRLA